jgi:hypothetical protein
MKLRRPVTFHLDGKLYGSMWTESDRPINISIGLHNRRDPVRTFIHECVHILYPNLSEKGVYSIERWMWKHITPKEKFFLAKKLYNRKWRTR